MLQWVILIFISSSHGFISHLTLYFTKHIFAGPAFCRCHFSLCVSDVLPVPDCSGLRPGTVQLRSSSIHSDVRQDTRMLYASIWEYQAWSARLWSLGRHNPKWTALHTKKETSITCFLLDRYVDEKTMNSIFNGSPVAHQELSRNTFSTQNFNAFSSSTGADDYKTVFK